MIKGQTMLQEQKEQLLSLMDDNQCDVILVDTITHDDELKQCWHRYHIARDVMQGKLHDCALTFDIADKVANAIALDDLFDQTSVDQAPVVKSPNLFWIKAKDVVGKLTQVGLAACVTLGIIAGVQYQQGSQVENAAPVLNTMPVGVNVSPVGGVPAQQQNYQVQNDTMDQQQYNKIRLLIQDYELQKRLNVQ